MVFLAVAVNSFIIPPSLLSSGSRFMRKPNVGEALAQFRALAGSLNRECEGSVASAAAHAPYAAFCSLAVARCEQSMQRSTPEAEALLEAGGYKGKKEGGGGLTPAYHRPALYRRRGLGADAVWRRL